VARAAADVQLLADRREVAHPPSTGSPAPCWSTATPSRSST
jgi:hypothetical protein